MHSQLYTVTHLEDAQFDAQVGLLVAEPLQLPGILFADGSAECDERLLPEVWLHRALCLPQQTNVEVL